MWIQNPRLVSVGFVCAALLAGTGRPASAAPLCPQDAPVPPVSLDYAEDRLATDNRYSMSELKRMIGRAEHPVGLYRSQMAVRTEVEYEVYRQGRAACVRIRQVAVHLRLAAPRISIARELDPDVCRRRVTMIHETVHYRIDQEIIRRYAPTLKAAAEQAAARLRPLGGGDGQVEALQRALLNQITQAVRAADDRMEAQRSAEQSGHDSPQEYRRANSVCPTDDPARSLPLVCAARPELCSLVR
jgi:hypothetical protein